MADEKSNTSTEDESLHAEGLRIYAHAVQVDEHNRTRYADDIRFARLGEQWPEAIRKKREQEGRPCLTINRMTSIIRQVVNDARQNKPAIKFHAVGDGADEWTAKVLDGVVRNIEYSSNADVAYDTAIDNAVSGNVGYFRITTDYAGDDVFDQDIGIERIADSLSVVPDAYALDADSANWNDAFVTDDYSLDAFKAKWPKADAASFEGDGKGVATGWLSDNLVRVAEWWRRRETTQIIVKLSNGQVVTEKQLADPDFQQLMAVEGIGEVARRPARTMKVEQIIMNGCEVLETNAWAGKFIPIVPVYGDEVIIDGKRHLKSLIHDAKDPQRMLNYWRTASTELVALAPKAPWVGPVGSFASDPNWATANSENHQYLEYDPVDNQMPPQRQPFAGPPAGALQEALNASDDIKSTSGIFDASLGAQGNETSGRAILARQREGDTSTFNFTDNLSRAIRHAGRIMADLIPKVYTVPRVLRIIQEDGSNRSVAVNQQTEPLPEEAKAAGEEMQGVMRIYDLTSGKYDVTCEAGPSYTTKRQEAAAQMTEFMRAVPGAGQVMGDLLAKNLDWPGADEIADRLKLLLPPQAQGQNPQLMQAQQQMQQMQQMLAQAQQQIAQLQQDKQLEQRKLDIAAHKADTDRLKALGVTLLPEVAAAMGLQVSQGLGGADITPGGPAPQPQAMPQPMPEPQPAAPEQPQPQPFPGQQ